MTIPTTPSPTLFPQIPPATHPNAPVAMTHIASYGYDDATPILSDKTKRFRTACVIGGIVGLLLYFYLIRHHANFILCVVGIAVMVMLVKFFGRKVATTTKELLIFTRYLILGDKIVYYQNVQTMHIHERNGTITLILLAPNLQTTRQLVITRQNFKTVTTKPDKKRLRQQEKFSKLCQELRQLVAVANPHARICVN